MGLLDNALQAIKNQYQETKGNIGLLMSDPRQYMSKLNQEAAEYNRLSSLAAKASMNEFRGLPITPEQAAAKEYIDQKQMDLALGFTGSIKPLSNAEKLGFTKDAYHFSKTGADIKEFVPGMQDLSPFGIGTHVGTKEAALDRFLKTTQTGATYPLKIKTERQFLNKEGNPFSEEQLSSELRKLAQKIGDDKGIDIEKLPYKEKNQILSEYMWKKYDAIPYINDVEAPGSVSYIVPSQNIRSRFAQFDPTKVGSKDILAGVVPLGLIAEDDKKQKKDMRK
jgi:hypothetical protein